MRTLKNDVKIPRSFVQAQPLLDAHPEVDRNVHSLAILLPGIGWAEIDKRGILANGFTGSNMRRARYLFEAEGVRFGIEVLTDAGWEKAGIAQVCEINDTPKPAPCRTTATTGVCTLAPSCNGSASLGTPAQRSGPGLRTTTSYLCDSTARPRRDGLS